MIDANGTRIRLSDKMLYVAIENITKAQERKHWHAHLDRLDLIAKPFPAIIAGRVVQSAMIWSGVLIGGHGNMQTDEEAKRGRRVMTNGPILDNGDMSNRSSYYADRTAE